MGLLQLGQGADHGIDEQLLRLQFAPVDLAGHVDEHIARQVKEVVEAASRVQDLFTLQRFLFVFVSCVPLFCEGVFILSITSKPEKSGLFSLLASSLYEFSNLVLYHTLYNNQYLD